MENMDRSYRYVMEELTEIHFGAKLTYAEIIDNEDVSYRFRQACAGIFSREVDRETSLESHFFYMDPASESARVYGKLKTKVTMLVAERGRTQKDGSPVYTAHVLAMKDFLQLSADQRKAMGAVVQEITVSKFGLAGLVI